MDEKTIWLAAGLRTPFVGVDGPFAHRDSLALSVPVVQAMAPLANGQIDFAVWGAVVGNLAYANLAREVWLEAKLDPHVPTFTTIMQCSTSMVGVFEAAGILGSAGPVAGACWRRGKYDACTDRTWTESFGLAATGGAGAQLFAATKCASETPPLRHSAVRARGKEPGHWPQYGRAYRRHGKDLEYQPSRTR